MPANIIRVSDIVGISISSLVNSKGNGKAVTKRQPEPIKVLNVPPSILFDALDPRNPCQTELAPGIRKIWSLPIPRLEKIWHTEALKEAWHQAHALPSQHGRDLFPFTTTPP